MKCHICGLSPVFEASTDGPCQQCAERLEAALRIARNRLEEIAYEGPGSGAVLKVIDEALGAKEAER